MCSAFRVLLNKQPFIEFDSRPCCSSRSDTSFEPNQTNCHSTSYTLIFTTVHQQYVNLKLLDQTQTVSPNYKYSICLPFKYPAFDFSAQNPAFDPTCFSLTNVNLPQRRFLPTHDRNL